MAVLLTDLIAIQRGPTLHKALVSEMPLAPLAKAALNHSAGVIDLDVGAADVFDFEADAYSPPSPITMIGSDTGEQGSGSGAESESLPSGMLPDDYVLAAVGNEGGSIDASSSWTELISRTSPERFKVFGRKMGDPVSSSISFSYLYSNSAVVVQAFRGVDPDNPLDALSVDGSASYLNAPAITTVTPNAKVVAIGAVDNNHSPTAPTGYGDLTQKTETSSGMTVAMASKTVEVAGVEDPGQFNNSVSGTGAVGTVALRPVSGATGTIDYTLNLTNKPADVVKPLLAFLEVKTTAGSWNVSAIDEWIGSAPDLNVVGKHAIQIWANATLTVAEYKGLVA